MVCALHVMSSSFVYDVVYIAPKSKVLRVPPSRLHLRPRRLSILWNRKGSLVPSAHDRKRSPRRSLAGVAI